MQSRETFLFVTSSVQLLSNKSPLRPSWLASQLWMDMLRFHTFFTASTISKQGVPRLRWLVITHHPFLFDILTISMLFVIDPIWLTLKRITLQVFSLIDFFTLFRLVFNSYLGVMYPVILVKWILDGNDTVLRHKRIVQVIEGITIICLRPIIFLFLVLQWWWWLSCGYLQ